MPSHPADGTESIATDLQSLSHSQSDHCLNTLRTVRYYYILVANMEKYDRHEILIALTAIRWLRVFAKLSF